MRRSISSYPYILPSLVNFTDLQVIRIAALGSEKKLSSLLVCLMSNGHSGNTNISPLILYKFYNYTKNDPNHLALK